jgi:hypothetical protein
MTLERRSRQRAWMWAAAGLALTALAGWLPPRWSTLALVLAQPAWSLALGATLGRTHPKSMLADLRALALLWGLALGGLWVLVAWPVAALQANGSIGAALGLGLAVGVAAWLLWRLWPVFGASLRHAAGNQAWTGRDPRMAEGWRGRGLWLAWGLLAWLALLASLSLLDLWPAGWRWSLLAGCALLAPGLHALLHRWGEAAPLDTAALAEAADARPSPRAEGDAEPEADPDERLWQAARNGRIEAALAALADGADPLAAPDPEERDQRSLAALAAVLGDLRLLRELIGRGIDLNRSHGGLTPLLAATRDSWHGRPEAVMTLLANGADPRSADAEGNTPLHHAARSSDPAVAALLLDAGAPMEALNGEGFSPLGIACEVGNWRLAKFLLDRRARAEPPGGQPALLAACQGDDDDPAGVELLLRHKARVDSRGARQRSALHEACARGHRLLVETLLKAGADADARDEDGRTPLLEAARGDAPALVPVLLAAGARIDAEDPKGRDALILAVEHGASPELLDALLAAGADAQHRDGEGRRALEVALGSGRWPLVARLDPAYPLPSAMADAPASAAATPREQLQQALAASDWTQAAELLRTFDEAEALKSAALLDNADRDPAAFDWLLRQGARSDLPLAEGCVLGRLLDRGPDALPALARLLDGGHAVGGSGGLARFLAACLAQERATRALELFALGLLARGACAFAPPTGQKDPPLLLAIRLGWQELALALLDLGVDPNARDGRGQSALHLAVALGRRTLVPSLLRQGALPTLAGPDGQNALGLALSGHAPGLLDWLRWSPWQLPGRRLLDSDLAAAAMTGDAVAVDKLLALGLSIDGRDAQGCTALLRAAGGGHGELVQRLLERGADPNLPARTGATPLSAAISMRHQGIVDHLIAAGADPNHGLPGQVTPLMLAAALGLPEVISRLLGARADLAASDDQGLTAMHCAALYAFGSRERQRALAVFDVLLLAEGDPDHANQSGQTPLLLLLGARAEPGSQYDEDVLLAVLERLLSEGVSLDAQEQRGYTALHLAALHGQPRVVARLLREGADRQRRDHLGRRAQDLAIMRGFVDISAEFNPGGSTPAGSPPIARFLREPRN